MSGEIQRFEANFAHQKIDRIFYSKPRKTLSSASKTDFGKSHSQHCSRKKTNSTSLLPNPSFPLWSSCCCCCVVSRRLYCVGVCGRRSVGHSNGRGDFPEEEKRNIWATYTVVYVLNTNLEQRGCRVYHGMGKGHLFGRAPQSRNEILGLGEVMGQWANGPTQRKWCH